MQKGSGCTALVFIFLSIRWRCYDVCDIFKILNQFTVCKLIFLKKKVNGHLISFNILKISHFKICWELANSKVKLNKIINFPCKVEWVYAVHPVGRKSSHFRGLLLFLLLNVKIFWQLGVCCKFSTSTNNFEFLTF